MPIYEYICQECQVRFEKIRCMADADAPLECERCHSSQTRRAVSAAFAHSGGRVIAGGGSSCQGCSGGSCSSCGHH